MIDNHTDNVYIAVAASAYRVNTKGEIYQLVSGAWLLLEDKPFDERPTPTDIQPVIYDKHCRNPSPTILRIAGGAAGQSGLIQALSDAFNKFRVSEKFDPCRVAWYKTSPSESLRYLNDGIVDVVITRNSVEVATALNQSIRLSPLGSYLIFREPLLLVGPLSNPANLDPNSDIITMFRTLRQAAQLDYTPRNAGTTDPSASFETRGDGSATHLRECQLWEEVRKVDQPPHLPAFFPYIPINRYPPLTKANIDASLNLYGAANLGYYTLTESSMYRLKPELHTKLTVYKHGQLNDPNDLLVLQGHLLVGARAQYPALAEHFAAWAAGPAGQSIVRDFRICGRSVY
ncbi:uncharacterized protein BO80DRAFT_365193 [Aspergillus ibericus CBS 121593]|uniref:PBP domain-containing protein n=1 Tax=Aspergillus ibericus CBS 121593 TaxID=1448316 RepID=A0A395GNH2_9EURO|nr:hypothetical protein BO80DRAFT_365193 [Aspergillus ibericus CBS 121593]RAK96934.1 hypothetical protein BO80DRAFT_365193 [Aspergillus ibericus CBS 121593]